MLQQSVDMFYRQLFYFDTLTVSVPLKHIKYIISMGNDYINGKRIYITYCK